MINFCIEKYSYKSDADNEILKEIPMLLRRKLSDLDKLALTNMLSIYDENIENVVFSSRYGEYSRLLSLIESYLEENEVSPLQFSSSVHNYLVGIFSLIKKSTVPYYALASDEDSLDTGLMTSIISNKATLFCYADTYLGNKSVACIIKPSENGYTLKKRVSDNGDDFDTFIHFLDGNVSCYKTKLGVIQNNG